MCTNTLSNEEMIKIKVVDLHEFNNFDIHHFSSRNHWVVSFVSSAFNDCHVVYDPSPTSGGRLYYVATHKFESSLMNT
jgi:hypothetical protein